jgi:hypothetical protein
MITKENIDKMSTEKAENLYQELQGALYVTRIKYLFQGLPTSDTPFIKATEKVCDQLVAKIMESKLR